MNAIHFLSASSNPYQAFAASSKVEPVAGQPVPQKAVAATPARTGDTVSISQAGRDALAAEQAKANTPSPMAAKLAEIQAKSPVVRTPADVIYVQLHAPRLAEDMVKAQKTAPAL